MEKNTSTIQNNVSAYHEGHFPIIGTLPLSSPLYTKTPHQLHRMLNAEGTLNQVQKSTYFIFFEDILKILFLVRSFC